MDGIERDIKDNVRVLRLSVDDSVGRALAVRYGVRSVPTLVLLDGDGNVILQQAGSPRREDIITALERLTG